MSASTVSVSPAAFLSRVIKSFWAVIDLYVGVMAGYVVLHALFGTRWWPVGLLATFAHWLLLPLFVILPLNLWRRPGRLRRRGVAVLSGVGILGFLLSYGALFLPRSPLTAGDVHAVAGDALPLTVMTYNIENFFVPPDDLVEIISAADADIVGITELGAEQAAALEEPALYPYYVLSGDGIPGLGLLSRYPILEHELFYLEAQRLPHLRAVLDVDGVPLTVVVAHPPPPSLDGYRYLTHPDAASEITDLVAIAIEGTPAILLGDLNTTDQSDDYRILTNAGLIDSFRTAGWGFGITWPVNHPLTVPLVRIDYIFHTAELTTVAAQVRAAGGSDHLPVIAELLWDRASR